MKNKVVFVIIIAGLLMAMGGYPIFSIVAALVAQGVIDVIYAVSSKNNKRRMSVWWNALFKTQD